MKKSLAILCLVLAVASVGVASFFAGKSQTPASPQPSEKQEVAPTDKTQVRLDALREATSRFYTTCKTGPSYSTFSEKLSKLSEEADLFISNTPDSEHHKISSFVTLIKNSMLVRQKWEEKIRGKSEMTEKDLVDILEILTRFIDARKLAG